MKLLVTGANGQVGGAMDDLARAQALDCVALTKAQLDIADKRQIEKLFRENAFDAVINAAAWTRVDAAEENREAAFRANAIGPANLAAACAAASIPLIHFSTDYVFDGAKHTPYTESDIAHPVNTYGQSKLAGEQAVRNGCPQHLILRTSWVFSAVGTNFVRSILRAAAEQETLRVIADQHGKPTAADELARLTLTFLSTTPLPWGTYHVAQPEGVSWYEFAESILAEASHQGITLKATNIAPIASLDYAQSAPRPSNSVLDCVKVEKVLGKPINSWHESLPAVIAEMKNGELLS